MIFSDDWTEGLTPAQEQLLIEYIQGGFETYDGIAGYRKVSAEKFLFSKKGIDAQSKYVSFHFKLNRPKVREMIRRIQTQRAFYNPADIIDKNGNFKLEKNQELKDLGPNVYCVEGVKKTEEKNVSSTEIKLSNRDKAIEYLHKLYRLDEDEEDQDVIDGKSIYEMSDEERIQAIQKFLEIEDNREE